LKAYLASLEKVRRLEVDLVLPGHRRIFKDLARRVQELKQHHKNRLNETVTILKGGPQNAFQVASQMTWDIDCESFDQFPVAQRWFATGEALSHLIFLEKEGRIRRRVDGGIVVFGKKGS